MSVIEVAVSRGSTSGTYDVVVVHSAVGEASATVAIDAEDLLLHRDEWQQSLLASAARTRRVVPRIVERPLRQVGEELFAALFSSPAMAGRYRASLAVAQERGESLRLVLRINAPELAPLPWEAMYDAENGSFVSRREPLVRHVPVASGPAPLSVTQPLRILAIASAPRGLPPLDVEKEQDYLAQALAYPIARGAVEVHWATTATWEAIQTLLLSQHWHVIHFVGHGDFDMEQDEGVLALVGPDGRVDRVEAGRFADLLGEADPTPRLVVLNTCASAQSDAQDLFSGTAAALVRSGINAVAAMQFEITDTAAIAFARGFYTAIAQGRAVDEAVRSGRVAILGTNGRTFEWVTPVLYLRGDDARIFAIDPTTNVLPTTPVGPVIPADPGEPPGRGGEGERPGEPGEPGEPATPDLPTGPGEPAGPGDDNTRRLVLVLVSVLVAAGLAFWLWARNDTAGGPGPATTASSNTSSATTTAAGRPPAPLLAWQAVPGVPTIGSPGVTVHKGELWVAGGASSKLTAQTTVRIYNPTSRLWREGPALPEPRSRAPLVSNGAQVFLIGGLSGEILGLRTVYRLDSEAGKWVEDAPLPAGRFAGAAAWDGTRIVFGGGVELPTPRVAASDIWTLSAGRWVRLASLRSPREHLAAATNGAGTVWFAGGTNVNGGRGSLSAAVDMVVGSTVTSAGSLPFPVHGLSAVWTPSYGVCAFGGSTQQPNNYSAPVADSSCLNAPAGGAPWPALPQVRNGSGAAVLGDTVYVVGGTGSAESVLSIRYR